MTRFDGATAMSAESKAKVAITVNLEGLGVAGKMDSASRRLVEMVGEYQLPITWAIDSTDQLPWIVSHENGSAKQDFALVLADRGTVPEASQNAFRDYLSCRVETFRQAAVTPTSVLIHAACNVRPWLRQLAQHGLATILVDASTGRNSKTQQDATPRPMPWGLWKLPANVILPIQKRWMRFAFSIRLPKPGRTPIASSAAHVIIHAQQIVAQGRGAHQQVRQLLHKLAWAKSARELDVVTAADWTRAVAEDATVCPQRSILRIAA